MSAPCLLCGRVHPEGWDERMRRETPPADPGRVAASLDYIAALRTEGIASGTWPAASTGGDQ